MKYPITHYQGREIFRMSREEAQDSLRELIHQHERLSREGLAIIALNRRIFEQNVRLIKELERRPWWEKVFIALFGWRFI